MNTDEPEPTPSLPSAEGRRCGSCAACCTGMQIAEIGKEEGERCEHMRGGMKRCAIYDDRPSACRGYKCAWLAGFGMKGHRPDKIGIFLNGTVHPKYGFQIMQVHEVTKGAAKRGKGARYVEKLREQVVIIVVEPTGRRYLAGGPRAHLSQMQADLALKGLKG